MKWSWYIVLHLAYLIPGHNTLSQNTYQNTFSKTPSGQNTFLVYTYSV